MNIQDIESTKEMLSKSAKLLVLFRKTRTHSCLECGKEFTTLGKKPENVRFCGNACSKRFHYRLKKEAQRSAAS